MQLTPKIIQLTASKAHFTGYTGSIIVPAASNRSSVIGTITLPNGFAQGDFCFISGCKPLFIS